jgi:hypothetical protein
MVDGVWRHQGLQARQAAAVEGGEPLGRPGFQKLLAGAGTWVTGGASLARAHHLGHGRCPCEHSPAHVDGRTEARVWL